MGDVEGRRDAQPDRGRAPAAAVAFILIYALVLAVPVVIAILQVRHTGFSFIREVGKCAALVGIAILAMQAVLSARIKGVTRHYGLDMIFGFHKAMALLAGALLVFHPIGLALGGSGLRLFTHLQAPWYLWAGKGALALVILQVASGLVRRRLPYERWRLAHNVGLVLLPLAFVHSWFIGHDLQHGPMRVLWVVLGATAVAAYAYHKVRRGRPCRVAEVKREANNVCTVSFETVGGRSWSGYLPGQFHFVQLYRGDRYNGEEHHFTIASSPQDGGTLTSTIKASGDFTATVPDTQAGDKARIAGPYGRFSYLLHPDEEDLVFVAGGIGITPLMSMLRHMRDTHADLTVCLLWGNRTEKDIIFRDELSQMAEGESPRLQVVHILSAADSEWSGETGYIQVGTIRRHCGDDLSGKAFWICGPPPMMAALTKDLRRAGVPAGRIHSERFAL